MNAALHYYTCTGCGKTTPRWRDGNARTVLIDCLRCGDETEHRR